MLRTLLVSATLLLASFGATAADRLSLSNDAGGEIRITDEQNSTCTGSWFRTHVNGIEGCAAIGLFSRDGTTKLVIIRWFSNGEEATFVYPLEDFEQVQSI